MNAGRYIVKVLAHINFNYEANRFPEKEFFSAFFF